MYEFKNIQDPIAITIRWLCECYKIEKTITTNKESLSEPPK